MALNLASSLKESAPIPHGVSGRWEILDLGEVGYAHALHLQERCREAVEAGHPGFWLLLQHPAVVTAGRRADAAGDLTQSPESLSALGVAFARTDRGGRLTYHHPGQVMGYPILNLRRERWKLRTYIEGLAALVAGAIEPFGIGARFDPDHPGLWVRVNGHERKVASMGIHVRRSITTHGFALNVRRPTIPLPGLKMCGLETDRFTTLEDLLGTPPDLHAVKQSLALGVRRLDTLHA